MRQIPPVVDPLKASMRFLGFLWWCLSLLGLMLLLSCDSKPEASAQKPESSVSAESGGGPRPTATPPAEETVAKRLDQVIKKANATHASLLGFIDTIFDDALRQGGIIGCSTYRVMMLTGRSQITDAELSQFRDRLSAIADPSGFISFKLSTDYYHPDVLVIVPPSVSYERSLTRKNFSFDYQGSDAWKLRSCEEAFKAPIPNSEPAREEERQRFGQMIVRSRLRLQYYEKLLPEIEAKASRALSLKASLGAAKGDLAVDLNPEMATVKVREYEEFLNTAAESLSQWRKEAAVDSVVAGAEVDKVLAIASR